MKILGRFISSSVGFHTRQIMNDDFDFRSHTSPSFQSKTSFISSHWQASHVLHSPHTTRHILELSTLSNSPKSQIFLWTAKQSVFESTRVTNYWLKILAWLFPPFSPSTRVAVENFATFHASWLSVTPPHREQNKFLFGFCIGIAKHHVHRFQFTAHWMSVGKSENKMMQWNFFRSLVALDYSL